MNPKRESAITHLYYTECFMSSSLSTNITITDRRKNGQTIFLQLISMEILHQFVQILSG
jgi:hypothetical protein